MTVTVGPADRWSLADRRLYLCTPDRPDLDLFLSRCIEGGVDLVQLRDKHIDDGQLVRRAAIAQQVCGEHDVPFVINDRPDLAADIGADGVHLGQDDMAPASARAIVGDRAIIGLSTHTVDELESALGAVRSGTELDWASPAGDARSVVAPSVDYLSAGPVSATPTKPGRPGTGLGYIATAVERAPCSVWVTGGVDPTTVAEMIAAGARHFVVVRWLSEAEDPRSNARALRLTIDELIDRCSP